MRNAILRAGSGVALKDLFSGITSFDEHLICRRTSRHPQQTGASQEFSHDVRI